MACCYGHERVSRETTGDLRCHDVLDVLTLGAWLVAMDTREFPGRPRKIFGAMRFSTS